MSQPDLVLFWTHCQASFHVFQTVFAVQSASSSLTTFWAHFQVIFHAFAFVLAVLSTHPVWKRSRHASKLFLMHFLMFMLSKMFMLIE